ncbi:MAG: putative sensor protein [Clostridia bacterium]|jgi:DUF438 domain-containing protein|nr:putative sensor protein [Clostridia bacterium]
MERDKDSVLRLIDYVKGLQDPAKGKTLYEKYKEDIENVVPQEVFEVFYALLQEGKEPSEILIVLDKVINVFYKPLMAYGWTVSGHNQFLKDLMLENKALVERTNQMREVLKEKPLNVKKEKLAPKIEELQLFNDHYLKKENILFPYLERKMDKFEGLSIMWALHDEIRRQIKEMIQLLRSEESNEMQINTGIGKLFFAVLGLVKKEELILFPAASEILDDQEWDEMYKQSLEYHFPFIEKKAAEADQGKPAKSEATFERFNEGDHFKTETGVLSFEQAIMIFNALPVDLSFVDENNKVKFFTRPKDRIFPRSPAIIGRDVKNCHPPDSVHVVNKIIESFRSGAKDTASFWIKLKGKTILIQYFALRDAGGCYKGTLEVSQDITEIQRLEGEKRLLDWE